MHGLTAHNGGYWNIVSRRHLIFYFLYYTVKPPSHLQYVDKFTIESY